MNLCERKSLKLPDTKCSVPSDCTDNISKLPENISTNKMSRSAISDATPIKSLELNVLKENNIKAVKESSNLYSDFRSSKLTRISIFNYIIYLIIIDDSQENNIIIKCFVIALFALTFVAFSATLYYNINILIDIMEKINKNVLPIPFLAKERPNPTGMEHVLKSGSKVLRNIFYMGKHILKNIFRMTN